MWVSVFIAYPHDCFQVKALTPEVVGFPASWYRDVVYASELQLSKRNKAHPLIPSKACSREAQRTNERLGKQSIGGLISQAAERPVDRTRKRLGKHRRLNSSALATDFHDR